MCVCGDLVGRVLRGLDRLGLLLLQQSDDTSWSLLKAEKSSGCSQLEGFSIPAHVLHHCCQSPELHWSPNDQSWMDLNGIFRNVGGDYVLGDAPDSGGTLTFERPEFCIPATLDMSCSVEVQACQTLYSQGFDPTLLEDYRCAHTQGQ